MAKATDGTFDYSIVHRCKKVPKKKRLQHGWRIGKTPCFMLGLGREHFDHPSTYGISGETKTEMYDNIARHLGTFENGAAVERYLDAEAKKVGIPWGGGGESDVLVDP